jgi:HD-like signal output (HDOD) protein
MPRPIHDIAASTAASARSWLQSIDRTRSETLVPTATLEMWLNAVIMAAIPPHAADLQQQAKRTLMGLEVQASTAVEAQNDEWSREAEAEAKRAAEG